MTHDPEHPDLAEDFAVDADVDADDTSDIDTATDFVLPELDSLPELPQAVLDSMLDVAMDPATPEPEGDLVPGADPNELDGDFSDFDDPSVDIGDDDVADDFPADESGPDDVPLEVDDTDDSALFDDSSDLI